MGESKEIDWSQFAIRQPPADLEPDSFMPGLLAAGQALDQLGGLEPEEPPQISHYHAAKRAPAVTEPEFARLVLAQAWCAYVDEAWSCRTGCVPFDGLVADYINQTMVEAVKTMHHYVTTSVSVWRPKMWHRSSGRLHPAVERVIHLRIAANGGGCELCHAPSRMGVSLEQHHLHYRSFGYEVPSDVIRLCRTCHTQRHYIAGYPQDTTWTDSGIVWRRKTAQ